MSRDLKWLNSITWQVRDKPDPWLPPLLFYRSSLLSGLLILFCHLKKPNPQGFSEAHEGLWVGLDWGNEKGRGLGGNEKQGQATFYDSPFCLWAPNPVCGVCVCVCVCVCVYFVGKKMRKNIVSSSMMNSASKTTILWNQPQPVDFSSLTRFDAHLPSSRICWVITPLFPHHFIWIATIVNEWFRFPAGDPGKSISEKETVFTLNVSSSQPLSKKLARKLTQPSGWCVRLPIWHIFSHFIITTLREEGELLSPFYGWEHWVSEGSTGKPRVISSKQLKLI